MTAQLHGSAIDEVRITLPDWVRGVTDPSARYPDDPSKMRLAVALARGNVVHRSGGPFGAAVFAGDGRLVAVGVNSVERLHSSCLHAEVVALMFAQATVGAYRLAGQELVSSCDPCAMCLGAALWSGVRRILCGAAREDAERLGFDEGPVFPGSYRYLADRGVEVVQGILADDARAVLELYRTAGGAIYNPR